MSDDRRRIDLHVHSTASDGTDRPADLVRRAGEAGLDVIALTDHDTAGGWDEALEALPPGLTLVRGMEISCVDRSAGYPVSLHLLAYLVDPDEPALSAALSRLRESRLARAEIMVGALEADGAGVTWGRVLEIAGGGTVGRPHIARALIEQGLVPDVAAAFTPDWIGTGGRYWAGKADLDAAEAVRLVTGAGGVAVFAHPLASARGRTVGDDVIEDLTRAGLAGLEVDHPDHPPETRERARALAADLGLLATGSSDYHGHSKEQGLAEHTTDPKVYEALVDRAEGLAPVTG
jgi:3',5'-nucleoside bisphosphate phosphatase